MYKGAYSSTDPQPFSPAKKRPVLALYCMSKIGLKPNKAVQHGICTNKKKRSKKGLK
jgi:hypothetical protein